MSFCQDMVIWRGDLSQLPYCNTLVEQTFHNYKQ